MTSGAKKLLLIVSILAVVVTAIIFVISRSSLTLLPAEEVALQMQLSTLKETATLNDFITDGCSGNVSASWPKMIDSLSNVSPQFASVYGEVNAVPFEAACIDHDRLYHKGEGGYVGRFEADLALRTAVITYGIENASEIKERLQLQHDEEAIRVYEIIAETLYQGVRIGGAPCTGKPYAWGYGYGDCSLDE